LALLGFGLVYRCLSGTTGGTCAAPSAATATDYPDVPVDLICPSVGCEDAPTFFTTRRLASIVTYTQSQGGVWDAVDMVEMVHRFPDPGGGNDARLWLRSILRTGDPDAFVPNSNPPVAVGGTNLNDRLPYVRFGGTALNNRVDYNVANCVLSLNNYRVNLINDEIGAQIQVTYGFGYDDDDAQSHKCVDPDTGTQPINEPTSNPWTPPAILADSSYPGTYNAYAGGWGENGWDCFPTNYTPPGGAPAGFALFNKWLVKTVKDVDRTGTGSPTQTWTYAYQDRPMWHHDDPVIPAGAGESWGEWRGYSQVQVSTGTTKSIDEYRYYRGMDGCDGIGNPVRSVQIQNYLGGDDGVDQFYLSGRVRSHRQLNSANFELEKTLTTYEVPISGPDAGAQPCDNKRRMVNIDTTTHTVEGQNQTTVNTNYDSDGYPIAVLDNGLTGAGDPPDERCTEYTYARNPSAWVMNKIARETSRIGAASNCTTGTVLRQKHNYYDGNNTTLGAIGSNGDPTMLKTYRSGSSSRQVTTSYDAYGRVTAISGPRTGQALSTVYYPANENLTETIGTWNSYGQRVSFKTLDRARGLAVQETDVRGNVTDISYDGLGRITGVDLDDDGVGSLDSYQFIYTLPCANSNDDCVPTEAIVKSRQLQSGTSTSNDSWIDSWQIFDGQGRLRQTQTYAPQNQAGALSIVTGNYYDDRGLLTRATKPYSSTIAAGSFHNSTLGGIPTHINYLYDAKQRQTQATTLSQADTTILGVQYTSYSGLTTTTTTGECRRRSNVSDVRGRLVTVNEYSLTGTCLSNPTQSTYTLYAATDYDYTWRDEISQITDAGANGGNQTNFTYTWMGERITMDDPDAGDWSYFYDGSGNIDHTTNPLGQTVSYSWDLENRKTAEIIAGSNVATWEYNTTSGYGDGTTYTDRGQLTKSTRIESGGNFESNYTLYDNRNRLTARNTKIPAGALFAGSAAQTYTYSYAYDEANHQTSITYPDIDGTGGLGAETVVTDYNGATTSGDSWSRLGLPNVLRRSDSTIKYVESSQYDNVGRILGRDHQGPTSTPSNLWLYRTYEYDTNTQHLGRMKATVGTTSGFTNVQNDTYGYDEDGYIVRVTHENDSQQECFLHDEIGRLTRAWTRGTSGVCNYTTPNPGTAAGPSPYDTQYLFAGSNGKIGNMTAMITNGVTTDYTYPIQGPGSAQPHAPNTVGGLTYTWNADGSLAWNVSPNPWPIYSYDEQGRLRNVATAAMSEDYTYDADGQRILKKSSSGDATLYLEGQELRITPTNTKQTTRYYIIGGATIANRTPDNQLHWTLGNHQGTISYTVNAGTTTYQRQLYTPYGAPRDTPNQLPTERGFLGQTEDDSTGLTYLNNRYYNPTLAKFTQPDPLISAGTPQTLNKYSYSTNSPITYSDPSGLKLELAGGGYVPPKIGDTSSRTELATDIELGVCVPGQFAVVLYSVEYRCPRGCLWVKTGILSTTWLSPEDSLSLATTIMLHDAANGDAEAQGVADKLQDALQQGDAKALGMGGDAAGAILRYGVQNVRAHSKGTAWVNSFTRWKPGANLTGLNRLGATANRVAPVLRGIKFAARGAAIANAASESIGGYNEARELGLMGQLGNAMIQGGTVAIGAGLGAAGGATAGAFVGSIFPGPGTVIGAGIGGALGGLAGAWAGDHAGDEIYEALAA